MITHCLVSTVYTCSTCCYQHWDISAFVLVCIRLICGCGERAWLLGVSVDQAIPSGANMMSWTQIHVTDEVSCLTAKRMHSASWVQLHSECRTHEQAWPASVLLFHGVLPSTLTAVCTLCICQASLPSPAALQSSRLTHISPGNLALAVLLRLQSCSHNPWQSCSHNTWQSCSAGICSHNNPLRSCSQHRLLVLSAALHWCSHCEHQERG